MMRFTVPQPSVRTRGAVDSRAVASRRRRISASRGRRQVGRPVLPAAMNRGQAGGHGADRIGRGLAGGGVGRADQDRERDVLGHTLARPERRVGTCYSRRCGSAARTTCAHSTSTPPRLGPHAEQCSPLARTSLPRCACPLGRPRRNPAETGCRSPNCMCCIPEIRRLHLSTSVDAPTVLIQ